LEKIIGPGRELPYGREKLKPIPKINFQAQIVKKVRGKIGGKWPAKWLAFPANFERFLCEILEKFLHIYQRFPEKSWTYSQKNW
jgi:hypothetical protein